MARAGRLRIGLYAAGATACWLGAWGGSAAQPATAEPVLSGSITEVFDLNVRTSAIRGSLVGVRLGGASDRLSIAAVRGVVPESMAGSSLCFSATTADGIYSATGPVSVPADAHGRLRIQGAESGGERFPRFAEPLAAYRPDQFAGLLVASPDCTPTPSAGILPVSFGTGADLLSVAVNSQGALKLAARLSNTDGKRVDGDCKALTGQRTTAFDHSCTFRLDAMDFPRGFAKLDLLTVPAAGPKRRDSYELRLPR